jgi:1-aminocyclopropane-1-carboxylate deaminase
LLDYRQTPVQDVSDHPAFRNSKVRVLVKREDLNHPEVSGNKWWKLKYNIQEAIASNSKGLLTFGGAYSNHIYATAAAAHAHNLRSVGVIRGEEHLPLNPTLQFATERGMILRYIDRQSYRDKESPSLINHLHEEWPQYTFIPEGGTNALAVRGAEEFGKLLDDIGADYICLPVGTGGTMAGIIRGASRGRTVLGISVLANGNFLKERIAEYLDGSSQARWEILTDYSYGGYAKRHAFVTNVINSFQQHGGIPLDFVYTGKLMSAIVELVAKGYFPEGSTVLAIHTGGLQGHS